MFAERVLRDARVECVSREIVRSAEQRELLTGNNQVQNSFLGAHRAVAIDDGSKICRDAKSHAPTMTSAFHGAQHRSPTFKPCTCRRARSFVLQPSIGQLCQEPYRRPSPRLRLFPRQTT